MRLESRVGDAEDRINNLPTLMKVQDVKIESFINAIQQNIDTGNLFSTEFSKYIYQGILPKVIADKMNEAQRLSRDKAGPHPFADPTYSHLFSHHPCTVRYSYGAVYFGECRKGTEHREGRGVIVYSNGAMTESYWKDGKLTGLTRVFEPVGSYLETYSPNGVYKYHTVYNKFGKITETYPN